MRFQSSSVLSIFEKIYILCTTGSYFKMCEPFVIQPDHIGMQSDVIIVLCDLIQDLIL